MRHRWRIFQLPLNGFSNAADAALWGGELEAALSVAGLETSLGVGISEGSYTNAAIDLNSDDATDDADEALNLPRLARVTISYQLGYRHEMEEEAALVFLVNYAFRDGSYFTVDNRGILPGGHIINLAARYVLPPWDVFNAAMYPALTLYGRNLANEAFFGQQSIVVAPVVGGETVGSNFSPLKEGRTFGLELRLDWR